MSKSQAPTNLEALRRRCHELVDKLPGPALQKAARQMEFIKFKEECKKKATLGTRNTEGGKDGTSSRERH